MHVGFNLIFLVPGETGGMEVAAREMLRRISSVAPDGTRFTAFVNREAAGGDWGPGIDEVVVPVNATDRKQWVWGEQRHLPGLAAAAGCDVVHSLGSTAPFTGRFKRVTTIHDLIYKVVPEAHFGIRGKVMGALVPAGARRSHRIIVDAASTREDLARYLGTPRDKVDVVPLGVTGAPAVQPATEQSLRASLELGDAPLILSVSAKRPHKNLMRLVEAHAELLRDRADRPVLVLPGYPTEHEAELRARVAELATVDDVRFPAWLDQSELEGLYAAADVFVFPSLYEGFGLPVLEAMARGVPVATSGRASLAEVAGDAALTFDPESVPEMTRAIARLIDDPELAGRLRAAGIVRAGEYSWDRTAERTIAVYERTLASFGR